MTRRRLTEQERLAFIVIDEVFIVSTGFVDGHTPDELLVYHINDSTVVVALLNGASMEQWAFDEVLESKEVLEEFRQRVS